MNLIKNEEIRQVLDPISNASSTDTNSDRIDMQNYESVTFIVPIEDCADTGVATITGQQNTIDSDSGMAALSGATATATSGANDDLNNTLLVLEIDKPEERYIQIAVTSATANIAFGTGSVILTHKRKTPVSDHSSISQATLVVSPAEA